MRFTIALTFALFGCGSASDLGIRNAGSAAAELATGAAVAVAAAAMRDEPASAACANCGSWAPPAPSTRAPTPLLYTVQCRHGSYSMYWPQLSSVWSCYFEMDDGRRFLCNQSDASAPASLVEWCGRSASDEAKMSCATSQPP